MKKVFCVTMMLLISLVSLMADNVDFIAKTLKAGKASLTGEGYSVEQMLGVANFSPELKFPVQLIYASRNQTTGLFGFAWRSPQLESSAVPSQGGVLWTTPWGEKIQFYPKDAQTPKDAIKIDLYEEAKKGRGFYAPYSAWEADADERIEKISTVKDWVFKGKKEYVDWTFTYRNSKLVKIEAPSNRSLSFSYSRDNLSSISQDGTKFIELKYENNMVSAITINGVTKKLAYNNTNITVLPKTEAGNLINAERPGKVGLDATTQTPEAYSMFVWGDYTSVVPGDEIMRYEESEDASIFNSESKTKKIKILYASGDSKRMDAFLEVVKGKLSTTEAEATTEAEEVPEATEAEATTEAEEVPEATEAEDAEE